MANKITATLYDSDGNSLDSKTYSVQDYINDFNAVSADYPEYTVNAVEAIADYGHYALEFLAESKGWTFDGSMYNGMFAPIDAANVFDDTDLQTVKSAVSGYTITKNDNLSANGINDIDISLNLDSETSIYFYADVADYFPTMLENSTFSLPYESLTESLYRFKSDGIPAHKLDEAQELSFTFLGSAVVLASASPLTYVNAVLNSTAEAFNTEACRNAMIAIYRYYDCAKEYQEGARLDSYNLTGAKAYSGTFSGWDGFYYTSGNSYVEFSPANGATITVLRYHSTGEGKEIFAFVSDDGKSFIGTISDEDGNSFKVTRDDGAYSTITIEGSTLKTANDSTSTISTNLTDATPRDALSTILNQGYELPQ